MEIDAAERPRLLALNKVDLLDDERRRELGFRYPDAVQVSAETGEGLDELRNALEARFLATLRPMELLVPYDEGGRLSELHELAGEVEREDTPDGVRVRARVPAAAVPRFERFAQQRLATSDAALPPPVGGCARPPARAHDGDAGFDLHAAEAATLGSRRAGQRGHRPGGGDPRRARRAWCCPARASPPGTGSRWSTRPA